jgi:hypothetical protein
MDSLLEALFKHAEALGMIPMNKHPEGFHQVLPDTPEGDKWEYFCNGTGKEITVDETVKLEPYAWYVKYNGWPAGIFALRKNDQDQIGIQGEFAAGEGANEENFIKALWSAINAIQKSSRPDDLERTDNRDHQDG